MITQQINMRTSGQNVPKCTKTQVVQPLMINGCAVSFSSSVKGTDEPIKAVKEILFSAYKTKTIRG